MKVPSKFVGVLFVDGQHTETREFHNSLVRVGSVEGSDWRIQEASLREFFLVHDVSSGRWMAKDVTFHVMLNGQSLQDTVVLMAAGMIEFGRFRIEYKIVRDDHPEVGHLSASRLAEALAQWEDAAFRAENPRPLEQSADTQVTIGLVDEVRAILRRSPEAALEDARRHLAALTALRQEEQVLAGLGQYHLRPETRQGTHLLANVLSRETATTLRWLVAALTRAGGLEADDETAAQITSQFPR